MVCLMWPQFTSYIRCFKQEGEGEGSEKACWICPSFSETLSPFGRKKRGSLAAFGNQPRLLFFDFGNLLIT